MSDVPESVLDGSKRREIRDDILTGPCLSTLKAIELAIALTERAVLAKVRERDAGERIGERARGALDVTIKVAEACGWQYPIGEHEGGPDLYTYLRRNTLTDADRAEARRLADCYPHHEPMHTITWATEAYAFLRRASGRGAQEKP